MKRFASVLALLALVAAVAVWATGKEEKQSPAPAAVKLTFLNHNTEKPERAEFFTRMAEKYKALHPNVTIEVTATSFTDVNTQVLTAISAGTPYDLFTSFSMTLWKDKGVVLNLAPYLNANGGAWKNELYEAVLQAITYPDGSAYMIPLWMDTTPLLYHKEIFAKLGLKPPTNTQEFVAVAEALKKAGYIPFQVHGSMMDDLLNVLAWQFAAKYGVKPYDVTQGKVPFTDPWFTDALRLFKDLYDRGYLPANFWSMGGTEGRTGYATGKMAMRFGFFWDVDTQKDMGMPYENQGVAAFPNITETAGLKVYKLLGLTGVMISKSTKYPDVAADYLRFMVNKDNQDDMCYKYFGRYPNGMPAVNKQVKLSEYAMSYINDLAAGVTTPYPIADVSLKYNDTLGQVLPQLMQGKMTVEQCAAEMDKLRANR
jgi:ABC-type glycerol-3-phosphate transport system substrate-binding protein